MSRITKFTVIKQEIEQGLNVATQRYKATNDPYYQGQMSMLQSLLNFCNDLKLARNSK